MMREDEELWDPFLPPQSVPPKSRQCSTFFSKGQPMHKLFFTPPVPTSAGEKSNDDDLQ